MKYINKNMAGNSKDRNNMMYVMDKFTALSQKAIRFWGEPSKLDALFMSNNKKTDAINDDDKVKLLEEGVISDSRSPSPTNSDFSETSSKPEQQQYCLHASMVSVGLVALGCLVLYLCKDYLRWLLLWMERVDLRIAAIIFVVLFMAVSFPMMWGYILLNVAAGYLYGLFFGSLLTCGCAALGMFAAHELTRLCCREYVVSKLSNNEGLMAILRVVESSRGFKVVLLARLTPIPFGLQNGLFAISNISCFQYLSASILGLLPTQVLNAYVGTTLRSMEEVLTDSSNTITAYVVFFSQLLLTVALSTYMVRRARLELNRTVEEVSCSSSPNSSGSTSPSLVNSTNNNVKVTPPNQALLNLAASKAAEVIVMTSTHSSPTVPNGTVHTPAGMLHTTVYRDNCGTPLLLDDMHPISPGGSTSSVSSR